MSNTIGFSNFRRFINFPEIELGDITILVGGNNAGKSTLVKAMLLMRDFLKSRIERVDKTDNIFNTFDPHFSFDTEHVNVGEFYRAFCRQSPRKEDTISFTMKIDKFRFIVNIRGERKPGIIPEVSMIAVSDEDRNTSFTFDFTKGQMTARFGYNNEESDSVLSRKESVTQKLADLKKQLENSRNLDEISRLKIEIEQYEKKARILSSYNLLAEAQERYVTLEMSIFLGDNIGKLVIPELINGFVYYTEIGTLGDKRSKAYKEQEGKKNYLKGKASLIKSISEEIDRTLNKQTIEYIYAHSVVQTPFYSNATSSNDYATRTIHEFYKSRISLDDEELLMVEKWLKEFNIGTSFSVIPFLGDSYRIVIYDDENPKITDKDQEGYPGGIDLADKGMGTIQLVILLLRIATLIRKFKRQQLIILLEEPEQNLHPALQSKLADLVYEINLKYGVHFVIETHSEYMVRNSQVLVGKNFDSEEKAKDNPFKIFYMPQKGSTYPIGYTLTGRLTDKFESGFFDEAGKANFYIMRKERGLK